MLRRLQYHINVKIKNLLDHMILATVILAVLGLLLLALFAITLNQVWLGILWLCGLLYALSYFIDVAKFNEIVRKLDQDSLPKSIWISKAYFS